MDWKFERVESGFEEIPVGQYRIRIESVEKCMSQTGRDMLKLVFDVSGQTSRLFHYIVFLDDRPEITNRNLTQLFDSFDIADGDFNLANWKGKVGGCTVKHDEEGRAKVQYFLNKKQQEKLPAWKEPGGATPKATATGDMVEIEVDEDDLPF